MESKSGLGQYICGLMYVGDRIHVWPLACSSKGRYKLLIYKVEHFVKGENLVDGEMGRNERRKFLKEEPKTNHYVPYP